MGRGAEVVQSAVQSFEHSAHVSAADAPAPISQMLTLPLGNHTHPLWHYLPIDPRADAGPRVKAPKCEGGWAKSSPPPRFFACRISQTSRLGLRAPQNTSAIQSSMARRHDWTGPVLLPSALLDTLNVPIYEL